MSFKVKISLTVKRYSRKYGAERDNNWLIELCDKREINLSEKMRELKLFIDSV